LSKIVSIKRISAIFLAIVLVVGTITTFSPSFIIKGVNAQAQPYYGGMDNSYDDRKSYGMDDSYGYSDDRDDKKKYDSYGASDYGMDDARQNYDLYYNGEETYSQVDPYQQSYDSYEEMYSKYPTKDKKFVCEEGPFKGFFVVKPKFCDVELPPGPAGPQGPPGQNGTQGPAGPNQILATNIYTVSGNLATTGPDVLATSVAECEDGDTVLSGSYSVVNEGVVAYIITDRPRGLEDGWQTQAFESDTNFNISIVTFALCFDNPPLNTLASASVSQVQQQPVESSIISQTIENSPKLTAFEKQQPSDSPDLTATEKIVKLKTQWLELLP
jgi:hypothetical protein